MKLSPMGEMVTVAQQYHDEHAAKSVGEGGEALCVFPGLGTVSELLEVQVLAFLGPGVQRPRGREVGFRFDTAVRHEDERTLS